MAKFRYVYTNFWTDSKVIEDFTPEDRLFYLYLLTNEHTKQTGVYQITKKHMAFEIGYSLESVNALLQRFQDYHELIKYNEETREIAIKNWGKYNLVKGGKPILDCVRKELEEVKDISLLNEVVESIANENIKQLFINVINGGTNYAEPSKQSKPRDINQVSKREYIILRDGQRCFYTGIKLQLKDIEIDHINPRDNGGGYELSNLVVSYNKFNNFKSSSTDLYEVIKRWNMKYPEMPINVDEVMRKIKELKAFEDERESFEISMREAVENEIYDTNTLRIFVNTIRGQKEKENKKENKKEKEEQEQQEEKVVSQSVGSSSDFGKLASFYESNIGPLLPVVAQELGTLYDSYQDVELIQEAFKIAIYVNAKNKMRYTEGILKNWNAELITTYEQLKAKEVRDRNAKSQGNNESRTALNTFGVDLDF